VLAYHLWTWISQSLRAGGDTRDWKTLRRLLSPRSLLTTVLPPRDGRVLRIRKASLPDPEQDSSTSTLASAGKPLLLRANPS
jgi:hypothetical protein